MDHPFSGKLIAHRGLADLSKQFVENSLPAILDCAQKNIPIEIDVQYHSEFGFVVFHDETLERMFGYKANVADCTADFLKILRYEDGSKLLDLKTFLEAVDGKVPVLLEVKARAGTSFVKLHLMAKTLRKLLSSYKGELWIQSFSPVFLSACRVAKLPRNLGQLVTNWNEVKSLSLFEKAVLKSHTLDFINRIDFISVEKSLSNKPEVVFFKNVLGRFVFSWTHKKNHYESIRRDSADAAISEGFSS